MCRCCSRPMPIPPIGAAEPQACARSRRRPAEPKAGRASPRLAPDPQSARDRDCDPAEARLRIGQAQRRARRRSAPRPAGAPSRAGESPRRPGCAPPGRSRPGANGPPGGVGLRHPHRTRAGAEWRGARRSAALVSGTSTRRWRRGRDLGLLRSARMAGGDGLRTPPRRPSLLTGQGKAASPPRTGRTRPPDRDQRRPNAAKSSRIGDSGDNPFLDVPVSPGMETGYVLN